MTVTSDVSGSSAPVSAAVSPKRFSVSPGVSASRGNSYQESSASFLREKEEINQIDHQSSSARGSVAAVTSGAFHGREARFGCQRFSDERPVFTNASTLTVGPSVYEVQDSYLGQPPDTGSLGARLAHTFPQQFSMGPANSYANVSDGQPSL
jgi:hypothetical protein